MDANTTLQNKMEPAVNRKLRMGAEQMGHMILLSLKIFIITLFLEFPYFLNTQKCSTKN